jgi:hypothetical protein
VNATATVEQAAPVVQTRCAQVVDIVAERSAWTYEELQIATGGEKVGEKVVGGVAYDALLYIFSTLQALGLIERTTVPNESGPGAPRAQFLWTDQARVLGIR